MLRKYGYGSLLTDRYNQALVIAVVALALFNLVFLSSSGWAHFGWLALGYLCLLFIYRFAGLHPSAIGLSRENISKGIKYGLYVIAALLPLLLIVFLGDKRAFMDSRYDNSLVSALLLALIAVPLKTVFFEELAFRGILPALLLKKNLGRRRAAVISSLMFGLWHLLSATRIGSPAVYTSPKLLTAGGVFIATSAVGYLLFELRWRSGSLLAPILVHWFINGSAIVLAALSWS